VLELVHFSQQLFRLCVFIFDSLKFFMLLLTAKRITLVILHIHLCVSRLFQNSKNLLVFQTTKECEFAANAIIAITAL